MADLISSDAMEDFLDPSIFYDDFPPLLDFPCMSSSSSSSSPEPSSLLSSSSPVGNKNIVDALPPALSSNSSMEILEPIDLSIFDDFGYLDLPDNGEFFDPSSVLNNTPEEEFQQQQKKQKPSETNSDDLSIVFFEWLKMNKDSISEGDLRRVKIKKSTIECAAQRLGGGQEAMKQLLKLILEWVKKTQLRKKKIIKQADIHHNPHYNQNPKPKPNPEPNQLTGIPHMSNPNRAATVMAAAPPAFQPMVCYASDPFPNGVSNVKGYPHPPPTGYMVASSLSQTPSKLSFAPSYNSLPDDNVHQASYQNQFFYGDRDGLMTLGPSVTKEARRNRMARQKRILPHHQNHNHNHNHQHRQHLQSQNLGGQQTNTGTWVYMPSTTSPVLPVVPAPVHPVARQPVNAKSSPRKIKSVRRQEWKNEKNLTFLLQKVLKQSDVGNLGRIVLPKKEAETHLPELEARDGILIDMEDIETSQVWNMRYRFWPNNKSRMYILENTGDFVKTNGLEEGDLVVIYTDTKCGKYFVRGVKVRKSETKRSGKQHKRKHHAISSSDAGNSSSSSSVTTQTVK